MTDDITRLRTIIAKLVEAAEVMIDEFSVMFSEDYPTHDPEKEPEVIALRAAIEEAKEALS